MHYFRASGGLTVYFTDLQFNLIAEIIRPVASLNRPCSYWTFHILNRGHKEDRAMWHRYFSSYTAALSAMVRAL